MYYRLAAIALVGALGLLFIESGQGDAQTSPPCVYYGGYPWRTGGCLHADDLNTAISNANTLPNTLPFSAITSTPNTLSGYGISNGLRKDLNLGDVANTNQALANLETTSVVLTTGSVNVTAVDTIWKPTTDANTTFTLPATGTAVINQRHRLVNQSLGTTKMTIAANTAQTIMMPNGTGTSLVLPKRGDVLEFRYVGTGQWEVE
jgi:hypothetical protein